METNKNNDKALAVYERIDAFLQKETLNPNEITDITAEESGYLFKRINDSLTTLKGLERDSFLKKIEPFMSNDFNNQVWENNHLLISSTISKLLVDYGRMPSKSEIAEETGISRRTITRHLEEYKGNKQYTEHEEQYKIVKGGLLARLYHAANKGDVKAIKLYLEATGALGNNKTVNKNIIENQHNYIQINETRLSQEQIQKLSPERLKQIEELLKVPENIATSPK